MGARRVTCHHQGQSGQLAGLLPLEELGQAAGVAAADGRLATGRAAVLEARQALSLQEGRPRQHVQDLVAGHGGLLYKLWQDQGGSLYVCGKVAMARAVQVHWPTGG